MKKLLSSFPLTIGTFLHLLGGILVIGGVLLFPMYNVGWWNGFTYIYRPYSEWLVIYENRSLFSSLSLLLDIVLVALPLLSMLFILGTSTAGLFQEVSSRFGIWRRIVAIVGLIMHCLLGLVGYFIYSMNALVQFGAGFSIVLVGFIVMIVSTFLD